VFEGKKILITGGTGSLGQALTRRLLKMKVDTVRIFSRNENNQVRMEYELRDDRLRFFVGDIRDYPRLIRALESVDIVFHAAALKHVPVIEYNPFEAIKTNIIGAQNVINAALENDVEVAVGVGTDKSVSPLNTYGATKLLMEKLFVSADNYLDSKKHRTRFIALRYGNVLGSSGSVVPKFIEQIKKKEKITLTDPSMTRFSITMDEALDFILESAQIGSGSDIFVPKLRAYTITDLKDALVELFGKTKEEYIGIRAGEKLHESLISQDELRYTYDIGNKYVIVNPFNNKDVKRSYEKKMKKPYLISSYSSDLAEKITKDDLKQIIKLDLSKNQ